MEGRSSMLTQELTLAWELLTHLMVAGVNAFPQSNTVSKATVASSFGAASRLGAEVQPKTSWPQTTITARTASARTGLIRGGDAMNCTFCLAGRRVDVGALWLPHQDKSCRCQLLTAGRCLVYHCHTHAVGIAVASFCESPRPIADVEQVLPSYIRIRIRIALDRLLLILSCAIVHCVGKPVSTKVGIVVAGSTAAEAFVGVT